MHGAAEVLKLREQAIKPGRGMRDAAGRLIGEILALYDHELERRHDFIQWVCSP